MTPRIGNVRVEPWRLGPAEAELWLAIEVEDDSGCDVRGRWVGPRCALRSTVEVAYPLQPAAGGGRVVIPDPSLWEPASPFLYRGIIELWQGNRRVDRCTLEQGLRTLALGPKGLRWNQKLLELRGVARRSLAEAEARGLKDQGVNLILAESADASIWQLAQRLGLLVLGRLDHAEALAGHACTLGWLASAGTDIQRPPRPELVGLELAAAAVPPAGVDFLAIREAPDRLTLQLPDGSARLGQIEVG
jgi:hypothetical protein